MWPSHHPYSNAYYLRFLYSCILVFPGIQLNNHAGNTDQFVNGAQCSLLNKLRHILKFPSCNQTYHQMFKVEHLILYEK